MVELYIAGTSCSFPAQNSLWAGRCFSHTPMKKILHIALWFFVALVLFFYSAIELVGESTVLRHSAKVKPYSRIFDTGPVLQKESPRPGTLIFFLGDSSVAQPPWVPGEGPCIPAALEGILRDSHSGDGDISVIEWSFAGGRPFHYYCLLFEAEKYSPALLIIPINWRILGSVSTDWNRIFAFRELSASVPLSERHQHCTRGILQREHVSLQRQMLYILTRPMLYITGLKIWMQTTIGIGEGEAPSRDFQGLLPDAAELIGGLSDRTLFQQYANGLKSNNVQLEALHAITETATRRGINLLFYITPIHLYELRRRPCFDAERFQKSVELVRQTVSSESSRCLDLSGLLGAEDFVDSYEHYTAEGNRKIARALASAVQDIGEPPDAEAQNPTSLTMRHGGR